MKRLRNQPAMPSDYDRVEAAIRWIDGHVNDQPDLGEIAHVLGLSPTHAQRVFTRWAGVSPKRFLEFLTVKAAKTRLDESRSILDTSHDVGLSGSGRLHDHMVNVDAVTPGEYKSKGYGVNIIYGTHDTRFGACLLAMTDRGITYLAFAIDGDVDELLQDLERRWPRATLQRDTKRTRMPLNAIFPGNGNHGGTTNNLFLRGTNFQLKVWEALLCIPSGHTTTYQHIATTIGLPTAARAVGNAVGANPVSFLIPCHRVIQSAGVIGNYRWGPARKKAMLGWEAAQYQSDNSSLSRPLPWRERGG